MTRKAGLKIAVTGISGYLGGLILEKLEGEERVSSVLGIDVNPPTGTHPKLRFEKADIREPGACDLFKGTDALVHLAFIVETMHDRRLMYDINVNGSRNVIFGCERHGVPKLVVASSVAAYGNQGSRVVDEGTPLLADARSFYGHSKRIVEETLDVFEARNPGTVVSRIRPSIFVGQKCDTWAAEMLTMPLVFDTPEGLAFPVVHEDDVARGFAKTIVEDRHGTFLLALREPLTAAEMARISRKKKLALKRETLMRLITALFKLRITKMSMDWLVLSLGNAFRYDPSETEKSLGWIPEHSAAETYRQLAEAASRILTTRKRLARKKDRIGGVRYAREGAGV